MKKPLDCPLGEGCMLSVGGGKMYILEACKASGVTKKATSYYEEQGLISPRVLENGYRDYSLQDVRRLRQIAALRSLGLTTRDIRDVLTGDEKQSLRKLAAQGNLNLETLTEKQKLLQSLAATGDWQSMQAQAEQLDRRQSILRRMLDKFPGFFGQYALAHFAPYLQEPITNREQQDAFATVVDFLDNVDMSIPPALLSEVEETMLTISPEDTQKVSQSLQQAAENPEKYLQENKEAMEAYLSIRQSPAYQATPGFRLMMEMKKLNQQNGYNDVFLPAMRKLSPAYEAYYQKLLLANEALMKAYPEANGQQE